MPRALALAVFIATLLAGPAHAAGLDLSTYARVGRYDLPEPKRTPAPPNNLLASEASGVTYDWDTDTLFVVGDEGTAVTQVSKTGQLINTMTLAAGAFDDTEGIAYVGAGKFVLSEERERRVNLFTYAAGGTLARADVQSVKLGTTIGNIGIEGLTYDRTRSDFVLVKEAQPEGVFETGIDWAAGTATNGSATTENSVNLFNPALAGLADFSDVYAVDADQLLILSQEAGKIVNVTRSGVVSSSLTIAGDAGNPLPVPDQGHEGVAVDSAGRVYVVSEGGGGDTDHPQLWVYAPSTASNAAPTAVALNPGSGSIASTASTASRVKVADVSVTDDGIGTNALSVTGPDAASFEVDSTGLYLKAGSALSRASFTVSVTVDDTSVGATPDATSAPFALTVTTATLAITEVSPWSSGDSPYAADWFEITNRGSTAVDLTGWKVDDSSNAFASAIALTGVPSIAPGESVIFLEGDAAKVAAFKSFWSLPAGVQVGTYSGSGIGLSTDGDAVNLFNAAGVRVTGVTFGAATTFVTFDTNAGGLSVVGRGGAYTVSGATGSPGVVAPTLRVTEVTPWSSGNSPYGADWFEVTNAGRGAADLTGYKVDDSSNSFALAIPLNGVASIAPGQSVIFIEGSAATADAFKAFWFGANVPEGFAIGFYSGSGIGLSTDGDAVNLFDAAGNRVTGVTFGVSTTNFTFDNAAGLEGPITSLSAAGRNGAFTVAGATGSPGRIATRTDQVVADAGVVGLVPPQLSLVVNGVTFAPFVAGVAKDYTAASTATVTSTAGDAALSVSDPGHLMNGSFALPSPLQVNINKTIWTAPVSNDLVPIAFTQHIGANDALRTGGYAKTLTFTLSTTTP